MVQNQPECEDSDDNPEQILLDEIERLVLEDAEGDGGDSDIDREEMQYLEDDDGEQAEQDTETAAVLGSEKGESKGFLEVMSRGGKIVLGSITLDGAETPQPDNVEAKIPRPPDDWTPPAVKVNRKQPEFADVDNPGNWDE